MKKSIPLNQHPLTKVKIHSDSNRVHRKRGGGYETSSNVSSRSGNSSCSALSNNDVCENSTENLTGIELLRREKSLEKIHTFALKTPKLASASS